MSRSGLMLLVLSVFFVFSNINSQGNFEGKITVKVPEVDNSGELSYYLKGDKIRINVEGKQRNSDLIIDPDNRQVLLLKTQMNKYIVFPFGDTFGANHENREKFLKDFKNTGTRKTMNGYRCEKWIYSYGDREIVAWMTDKLAKFRFFKDPSVKGLQPGWQKVIEESGYFPMKIDEKTNAGESISLLLVKDVKSMKLEDNYFRPPNDFERMKMPNMDVMKNFMQKNR